MWRDRLLIRLVRLGRSWAAVELDGSTGTDWMKSNRPAANNLELFSDERARVERPVFRQFDAERDVGVNHIRVGDNLPDSKSIVPCSRDLQATPCAGRIVRDITPTRKTTGISSTVLFMPQKPSRRRREARQQVSERRRLLGVAARAPIQDCEREPRPWGRGD